MNPEISVNADSAGWVFFDAHCSLCVRSATRARGLLHRHGFQLVPLQTPGTTERLGVSMELLLARMHVLTRDGRCLAGADALVEIARHVWWAKPLAAAAGRSGILPLLRRCYDWIAARRHCDAGQCSTLQGVHRSSLSSKPAEPTHAPRRGRKRVFLEMP